MPNNLPSTRTATKTDTDRFVPRPLGRIDKALTIVRSAGVPIPSKENGSVALSGLVKDLMPFGDADVTAIVRTLNEIQVFNEIVRGQLDQASVGDRYVQIAKDFTSIREDSKRMLEQIEDGKLSLAERLQNSWMTWTRGSINKRFDRIRASAMDIHRASEDTIARMRAILEGYAEARLGLQEARILADEIRKKARAALESAQSSLTLATESLTALNEGGADPAEVNQAELARDLAMRDVQEGERRFQIAEDLYNNLSIAYNAGDAIMVRVRQTADVQERVWSQSVTFFGTNETVLTALSASFTQLKSLHESTQGHKALKDGVNEALKDLASTGTTIMETGLREGYGPTISAESVKALIDSIVAFQERSYAIKDEMRQMATENERAIHEVTESGRQRLAKLLTNPPTSQLPESN